jgi:hypothetical protein
MFTGVKKPTQLETALDRAFETLSQKAVATDEYTRTLEAVTELHKMKEAEKPSSVSPDTMLLVGANLVGILLIIRHEHVNVITSRAMSTLIKPR